MNKAFVLGAGLGTRLRPLTNVLPKPLIPVLHRPLISYAFDHLLGAGVLEFIVNTHHLPEKYAEAFPNQNYCGAPITFSHEPVLLETGGGIANIAPLVADDSFIVYNGDILTTLPLAPLVHEHRRGENLVTLVLRSTGPALHIAWDADSGKVIDIRNQLGKATGPGFQFTGIYAVSPEFLPHLTPGKIESVIPVFLKLIAEGKRIGAVVVDEGIWWDLGDRESYLDAHAALLAPDAPPLPTLPPITDGAVISPRAILKSWNVISDEAEVGAEAVLEECILWQGANVAPGSHLLRCIVRSGMTDSGSLENADV
jgi:mannose-1-phosphate guanylyltransferase/mannose-1-phosphate guanylyltransferase/phosphomannomutase